MKLTPLFALPLVGALAVSGCGIAPTSQQEVSSVRHSLLGAPSETGMHATLEAQAVALTESSDRLVRSSTVNGALIGAAIGCGLTVLSASNAKNCVAGAALGGAGGAAIGHAVGKQKVQRRVELVSPSAVVRNLRSANKKLDTIYADLPSVLAAQDVRLNALTMALAKGEISQAEHDRGVTEVKEERAQLAEALLLSERDARAAAMNLQEAAAQGQHGLEWHIGSTDRLADDMASARDQIDLL